MKTITPVGVLRAVSCRLGRIIALASLFAGAGMMLLSTQIVHGATLVGKAPNAAAYFGLPFTSLEFENPLAGNEMVLSHKVLDWRDADFASGPPPWYDDWTVSHPGSIDGNANEIWLRQSNHSAWATTTVPSTIVSIHLNSDENDGLAEVEVDGNTVVWLDMYTRQCCETVLIIVTGLSNTTHTITVKDTGPGQGGGDDVHIMGAAALAESDLKWDQPPLPAAPENIFYGWNQRSMEYLPPIAADDWVCTNNLPITKIRWWGSFIGWNKPDPPYNINAFRIRFWTDVPQGADPDFPFSHPGVQVGPDIYCQNFTVQWVGWDYDPQTRQYEACFLYEQNLLPEEWFYQDPGNGTNIYWISIEAVAPPQQYFHWGWKTRPRDPNSSAPDDAVMFDPAAGWYEPLWWPELTNSWDLAFELISQEQITTAKWLQIPDLSTNGMDVHATDNPGVPPPYLLADDFLCTAPGPITNITIWGSWTNDMDWPMVNFTLSIHADIPASQSPTGYSMPGELLWQRAFTQGAYGQLVYAQPIDEWWFTPPVKATFPGDHVCYQYDFNIPIQEAFYQEGTPERPVVYWLDVQAQIVGEPPLPPVLFGWKTCPTNWNDDAVWVNAREPYSGTWHKLTYPPVHPRQGQTVDMAFRINQGTEPGDETIKWSQPPMPYIPPDGFNGWNQLSIEGQQVVADDWVCTNANPVTDIHWWGSFIGWGMPRVPEQPAPTLPVGFLITFWTDVPQGPQNPYSYPGRVLHQIYCTNFTWEFVGWDFDPRNPAAPPEACFKWHQDLLPEEWFYQTNGPSGTNIYWISIAAVYAAGQQIEFPWGWKTRLRDLNSLAPDAAVASDIASPWGWSPIQYPPGTPWDMAFQLTTRETAKDDFGDAPTPYPTLLANNGARHTVVPGILLGNLIDTEQDGQPDATATGDDNANSDDEDGVILPVLVPGQPDTLTVTVTGSGLLSAWIDFGADGSWAEAGDQILADVPLSTGTYVLNYNVPSNAVWGATTFARFRFSTVSNLTYTGLAPDGEVEDHLVNIHPLPVHDLGDAPDSSNHPGVNMTAYPKGGPPGTLANYPTVFGGLVGPFGPIHWNPTAQAFLGVGVSGELEADAGPDQDFINNILPVADLPDLDGADDGLVGVPILPHCGSGLINVQVTWVPGAIVPMFLNVWCDWNRDGDWNDVLICPDGTPVPEWAGQNIAVPPGVGLVPVAFNAWHPSLKKEPIWVRVTLSELAAPPPLGSFSGVDAGDGPPPGPGGPGGFQFGETEDYYITDYDDLATFDFGDAPSPYPTMLPNGARHQIVPNFLLGRQIDSEPDGQPDSLALGDDNNNLADEDGVAFTTPVLVGTQACVNVFLTGPIGGWLDGWIDFDKNGSWDVADQIFASQPLVNGVNAGLCFNVPTNAVLGTNFARFRLSCTGGLVPTGAAQDGEVEDYLVVIRQRAPLTNIIITNIVVTNISVGGNISNVIKLQWNAQTGVQYQVQFLTTFSNTPPFSWTNVGPVFIGPANTFVETNSVLLERYYRVMAPYVWP